MSGRLIVLEGLDGSGKATQAGLLYEALCGRGEQAMKITFPNYESDSSALVKMYLGGAFGQDVNDVNAYAASSFYSVDRYASYKTLWGCFYHDGGTVIADRYTTSNAVHQCSKLPREEWDAYLAWLFDFEYRKIAIPEPDIVVYLDVDPEVSQRLMSQRYHGDEEKKDIHEKIWNTCSTAARPGNTVQRHSDGSAWLARKVGGCALRKTSIRTFWH